MFIFIILDFIKIVVTSLVGLALGAVSTTLKASGTSLGDLSATASRLEASNNAGTADLDALNDLSKSLEGVEA